MAKVKPLGDRVLVKPVEEDEQVKGGIIIPDTAKEKPQRGEIVAVGDGKPDDSGNRIAVVGRSRRHGALWQVLGHRSPSGR